MNIDEFFEWFEEHCRNKRYAMSAQTVLREASARRVDLGAISLVGRKHLLPRGWTRHLAKSGNSFYLPPKKNDSEVNDK